MSSRITLVHVGSRNEMLYSHRKYLHKNIRPEQLSYQLFSWLECFHVSQYYLSCSHSFKVSICARPGIKTCFAYNSKSDKSVSWQHIDLFSSQYTSDVLTTANITWKLVKYGRQYRAAALRSRKYRTLCSSYNRMDFLLSPRYVLPENFAWRCEVSHLRRILCYSSQKGCLRLISCENLSVASIVLVTNEHFSGTFWRTKEKCKLYRSDTRCTLCSIFFERYQQQRYSTTPTLVLHILATASKHPPLHSQMLTRMVVPCYWYALPFCKREGTY